MPRPRQRRTFAPPVRAAFAKRLREQRVQGGYARARSFAQALGIDENRYTRYERAEAEPDLTLIHKICGTLRVTPDELFGFAEDTKRAFLEGRARDHGARLDSLLQNAHAILAECLGVVARLTESTPPK